MTDGLKLTGYSSDNLATDFKYQTKKQARLNRHKMEWVDHPENGVIYFIYKVNGELRYYLYEQAILTLKNLYGKNVSKQGICYNSEGLSYTKAVKQTKRVARGPKCCYCECTLTNTDTKAPTYKTREHVIPKHKGGKIIKSACLECNREKGGLMLHSYIQMLNYSLDGVLAGPLYEKTQIKIKNANKIAKELRDGSI